MASFGTAARRAGWSRSRAILLARVLVPVTFGFLAINVWMWNRLGYAPLDRRGQIALVIGVVVTLGLGVGLMGLMFYSSRHGYDDGRGQP